MQARRIMFTVIAGCVAALGLSACGAYSPSMTRTGVGAATVAQLVPNSAAAGSGAFTMTVNGSGFGTDALVYWNGSPLGTMYVSGNQLMVAVPAADVASAGMDTVYVRTGGQNSNTVDFTVN